MTAGVRPDQRHHSKKNPCPVCGGGLDVPSGQGRRCYGFTGDDSAYPICTRMESPRQAAGTEGWTHYVGGPCDCGTTHDGAPASGRRRPREHVTVAALAARKQLDPADLNRWGVADDGGRVRIDYGEGNRPRMRSALRATDGCYWGTPSGAPMTIYADPKALEAARTKRWAIFGEGESDCWTGWTFGVPVFGIPGKGMWKLIDDSHVADVDTIYVINEADTDAYVNGVAARMAELGWAGTVRRLVFPEGISDLNDLYRDDHDAFLDKLHEAMEAAETVETPIDTPIDTQDTRIVPGGDFILNTPTEIPATWGDGQDVLAAEGESTMLVGPDGVGKTTLAQQIALRRAGLGDEVLGFPVKPAPGRILYIAADRPQQAARSMRRMVSEENRELLNERVVFHLGPPPIEIEYKPRSLLEFVEAIGGVSDVFVDSLKDLVPGLDESRAGGAWNQARQFLVAAGVQLWELHHQRKEQRGKGSGRPKRLADVYGSRWLTAGAGSVILLWGEPGDMVVDFLHLKQPAAPVGPFKILHDHDAGLSTVYERVDLLVVLRASSAGMTTRDAARLKHETESPTPSQVEGTRRELRRLERLGLLHEEAGQSGGNSGGKPSRWLATTARDDDSGERSRTVHAPSEDEALTHRSRRSRESSAGKGNSVHATVHGVHEVGAFTGATPLKGGDPLTDDDSHCVECGADVERFTPDGRPTCMAHHDELAEVAG